ncbi:unnamed protein product [Dicrocoelium dendriticum]|nr:unnamed protein product [Dicrocoelium dendriticum]
MAPIFDTRFKSAKIASDSRLQSVNSMTFRDPSSSTDARLYRTEHYKFDWTVDFTESVLRGSASLTVTKLHLEASAPLILDVNGLDIQTVKVGNTLVHWKILPNPTAALGALSKSTTQVAGSCGLGVVAAG